MYLFCVSYAGGSASVYDKWKKKDEFVNVVPIELPGHGTRVREKPCTDFYAMVNEVYTVICEEIKRRKVDVYAIYGHSMGCWIAFEVAKKILADPVLLHPIRLFFSGNCIPECGRYDFDLKNMETKTFENRILAYGGIPQCVQKHPKLFARVMTLIYADYVALGTYQRKKEEVVLDCDISVMNGTQDLFDSSEMEAWKKYAGRQFCIWNFPAGHFFIHTMGKAVFDCVCKDLKWSYESIYG